MSDGRPADDELEPTAEEDVQPADEAGDELGAADDENAELDGDEGLDDEDDLDEDLADDAPRSSSGSRDVEPVPAKPMAQVRGRESRGAATSSVHDASTSEDELPYVDDRVSKYWVGTMVAIFLLILAYGILFGKAGELTPATPSPSPSPSATPTLSASPIPSSSLTPAPSVTITPLPSSSIPHDGPQSVPPSPTPAPSS
jgi:hypothetical protein